MVPDVALFNTPPCSYIFVHSAKYLLSAYCVLSTALIIKRISDQRGCRSLWSSASPALILLSGGCSCCSWSLWGIFRLWPSCSCSYSWNALLPTLQSTNSLLHFIQASLLQNLFLDYSVEIVVHLYHITLTPLSNIYHRMISCLFDWLACYLFLN